MIKGNALNNEVIIKSARSVSKRPLTAVIQNNSDSSTKHNVMGSRKDSVKSLKNHSSQKNLHSKNGIA